MKQHLLKFLMLVVSLFPSITAHAYDFEVDGIYYNILQTNNQVEVTYKTNYRNDATGDVVIPEHVLFNDITYTVVRIGSSAYSGCSSLTSISIPKTVTSIEDYAFSSCNRLLNHYSATTTQTTCTVKLLCNIEGIAQYGVMLACSTVNTAPNIDNLHVDDLEDVEFEEIYKYYNADINGDVNIDQLRSKRSYYLCYYIQLPNGQKSLHYSRPIRVTTKNIISEVNVIESTPTTFLVNCSVNKGDAIVTRSEFSIGSDFNVKKISDDTFLISNLEPDRSYSITYTVTYDDEKQETKKITEYTDYLDFTTLVAEATSNTVAVIAAETNLSDDETGAGFEWRRYDAPDLVPSTQSSCPVIDGKLMGALKNLSANTYYKYRPYYTSASGNTYYGEWLAFGTADAYAYFEPYIRTYEAENVTSESAELKAYVVEGSDAVTSQGFEFWTTSNSMNRVKAQATPANGTQTVESSGQWMNVTLEGLLSGTEYTYRAFVTTGNVTTYGEEKTFTTAESAGVSDIPATEVVTEIARYTIDGRPISDPQTGINIVRYSDGSVRKELVR